MADNLGEVEAGLVASVKSAIRKDLDLDFVKKVKVELKGERTEARILALSTYRLYILAYSKAACKVESSVHILSIQSIESNKPLTLTICTGEKTQLMKVSQPKDSIEIIAYILAALKSFPSGNPDRLLRVTLKSESDHGEGRQEQVNTMVNNLRNADADVDTGPCGGFSQVYACMCDYYGQPYLEEVAWDVDTIYLSHDTKEFNLQDFDHLEQKEIVPIISALEYNSWFTKFVCRSVKLSSEVCDGILRILKKSSSIEELVLDGVSLGRDYFQKVGLALTSNPKSAINILDLSKNSMEDRGLNHLTGIIGKLPQGLVALILSENGLTSKGSQSLGQALKSSKHMDSSLKRLNLSRNPLKAEAGALSDFLANPNALTHLDLSHTDCCLDVLFGALIRGCVQKLIHLDLSGNSFTSKKKEVAIPQTFQQFFSVSQALEVIDLSDCKLPADAVRAILHGLAENTALVDVDLNLSKNELRSAGAAALAENLGGVKNVKKLNISDNGLEGDLINVLESLGTNQSVQQLCVGENFEKRNSSASLEALVQLISIDNSHIHTLSIADSKLKQEIIPLLDALGTNESIVELDISGNSMGDEGARILAKGLQLNSKLRKLHWDRNGTSHRGFSDISAALVSNHTLHSMPTPLHDASQCLKYHPAEIEQHLRKIEKFLLRNQSPHKVVTEQAYRLQQGLLVTSTQQQAVDRLIVQLQDITSSFRGATDAGVKEQVSQAKQYIQDADKMKQLLLKFQLCTSDSDVESKFAKLTEEFYRTSQDKMKRNLEQMVECAQEVCPYITTKDDVKTSLSSICKSRQRLSQTFVEEVILTQAAATILNRLSEDKLSAASVMADAIMDRMIRHMEASNTQLEGLLKEQRQNQALTKADQKGLDDTDDVTVAARKAKNRLSSAHQLTGENTEEVPKSHKRRPTVSRARAKKDNGSISEEVAVDIVIDDRKSSVDGVPSIKQPSPMAKKKAPSPPQANLDFSAVEQSSGDLKHLVKARARPAQGRRLPTRPSNRPQVANGTKTTVQEDEETAAAIDSFWATTPHETPKPTTTPNKSTKPPISPSPGKTPPKPAPKPKPKPAQKHTEDLHQTPPDRDEKESKKAGWIPKGGINLGLPGFFKKKSRDRSGSGNEANDAHSGTNTRWFADKNKAHDESKDSPSPKKSEREKKPSPKPSPSPPKPRDRAPSGTAPKPAVKPRDRVATAPTRPPAPQVRERIATVGTVGSREAPREEERVQTKPAPPRGAPKFGIGMGGLAGGGLLAEMKMRQERSSSFGEKNKPAEKKSEVKSAQEEVPLPRARAPSAEAEKEKVSEEGLVRPSSIKRPRVPSASGPKPYVKPREKIREEKKDEASQPERPARRKPSREGKEEVDAGKKEANGSVQHEAKEKLHIDKPDEADLWVKRDDLPSPKRSPRSPRAKSPSLKLETSKPVKQNETPPARDDGTTPPAKNDTVSPLTRAATFPKPWSPSAAPTRSLPRKFSWETKTEDLQKEASKDEGKAKDSEPEEKPAKKSEPEEKPAKNSEPEEKPAKKTEPEEKPARKPEPEEKPAKKSEPEETPVIKLEPEEKPARKLEPEEKPARKESIKEESEEKEETQNKETEEHRDSPSEDEPTKTTPKISDVTPEVPDDEKKPINDPLGVSVDNIDENDTAL